MVMVPSSTTGSIAVALAVVALGGYWSLPSAQQRAVQHLPTPPGGRLLLTLSIMLRHGSRVFDWMFANCQRYHGKPWRMQLLGRPVSVIVSTPEDVEHILKTRFEEFAKGAYTSTVLFDVLGQGIFAVDGELWSHQRKTASHLFSLQMMRDTMEETVREYCTVLCGHLHRYAASGETVEIKRLLDLFTMDVFTKIGFGVDVGGLSGSDNQPFLDAFDRSSLALLLRFQQPLWLWQLKKSLNIGSVEPQLTKDMRVIDNMINGIVSQSIQDRQDGKLRDRDLIALFIEKSRDETGAIDAQLIRDMAMNFIAAGRDTTSQSMSWFLIMMNRYPAVLARIREELDAKLPHLRTGGQLPTMEELQELVFLEAAIKENMRLNPVVAITSRTAVVDTTLYDGTAIRAGTRVVFSSYAMARLQSVWGPDAQVFNPDRWIDAKTGKLLQVSPFKYPVFLGGPRLCLGMKFAMMEMKITLATLLSKFGLRCVRDPFDITYRAAITMGVRGPVDVAVTLRE